MKNNPKARVILLGVSRVHTDLEITQALEAALGYNPGKCKRDTDNSDGCPSDIVWVWPKRGDDATAIADGLNQHLNNHLTGVTGAPIRAGVR